MSYYHTADPAYLSVCYHYLKQGRGKDAFPRILGHPVDEFRRHLKMLGEKFRFISLNDAIRFSCDKIAFDDERCGLLLTCDDGLQEHYLAAKIFADHGVKAVFFIPTCILIEREPANPTVIHYVIAHYGVGAFLKHYRNALEEFSLDVTTHDMTYERGKDDPWQVISQIKSAFKYRFSYRDSRRILLSIFRNSLLKDFPDVMDLIYMTSNQVREILQMGHSIGAHSHSHISVAFSDLTPQDFHQEIVEPKRYLEKTFNLAVTAFSYPFGGKDDCWSSEAGAHQTSEYRLAFTTEKKLNIMTTSPYDLGRYSSSSKDTAESLEAVLAGLISGHE